MKPRPRPSPHTSNAQCPEPDRLAVSEHSPAEPRTRRRAPRSRASPVLPDIPIDFTKFREAEQRLESFEGDLTAIQAQLWSRLQRALPGGHRLARPRRSARDQRHAQGAATALSQRIDPGPRPSGSAPAMASLLHSILQKDRGYLVRVIENFSVPPWESRMFSRRCSGRSLGARATTTRHAASCAPGSTASRFISPKISWSAHTIAAKSCAPRPTRLGATRWNRCTMTLIRRTRRSPTKTENSCES